jgi:hypothetical protein
VSLLDLRAGGVVEVVLDAAYGRYARQDLQLCSTTHTSGDCPNRDEREQLQQIHDGQQQSATADVHTSDATTFVLRVIVVEVVDGTRHVLVQGRLRCKKSYNRFFTSKNVRKGVLCAKHVTCSARVSATRSAAQTGEGGISILGVTARLRRAVFVRFLLLTNTRP